MLFLFSSCCVGPCCVEAEVRLVFFFFFPPPFFFAFFFSVAPNAALGRCWIARRQLALPRHATTEGAMPALLFLFPPFPLPLFSLCSLFFFLICSAHLDGRECTWHDACCGMLSHAYFSLQFFFFFFAVDMPTQRFSLVFFSTQLLVCMPTANPCARSTTTKFRVAH